MKTDAEKYAFAKCALISIWSVTQFSNTTEHAKIIVKSALDALNDAEKETP